MRLTENQKKAIIDFFDNCDLSIESGDALHVVEKQLKKYDLPEDLGDFAVAVEGELIKIEVKKIQDIDLEEIFDIIKNN